MTRLGAKPAAIEIDLGRTALIVVDMQNAFVSPGGMFDLAGLDVSGAAEVVEVHKRLLDACRTTGVPVIYLQMTYQTDLSNGGDPESPNFHKELGLVLMRQRPELDGTLLVEGTWDWEIVDGLSPEAGDRVFTKSRYSGFCGTGLAEHLRTADIRNLLFTGVATNVCVESTARDAYFEEFWPILVEDAMNHSGPDFNRQATLWNFEHVFGWVTDSSRLRAALATVPSS
jgi:ureidoacrylate peracid hydrolase